MSALGGAYGDHAPLSHIRPVCPTKRATLGQHLWHEHPYQLPQCVPRLRQ